MMINWHEARINLLKINDAYERRFMFTSLLTETVNAEPPPVIVGGHAVELYTMSAYSTSDIDLVIQDKVPFERVLAEWGFKKEGRVWWDSELGIAIDLIAVDIQRGQEQVVPIRIHDFSAYVLRIEEIIIDRLAAYVHWQSQEDCDWAKFMLLTHLNEIDINYIKQRAQEEGVLPVLNTMLEE